MIRRPTISTRTDTLFPYTTLCRADAGRDVLGGESAVEVLPLPPAGKLVHALIADRRNDRTPRGLLLDHLGVGVAEHTHHRQTAPENSADLAEAEIPSSAMHRERKSTRLNYIH